jgi:hypothetical protein
LGIQEFDSHASSLEVKRSYTHSEPVIEVVQEEIGGRVMMLLTVHWMVRLPAC